MKRERWYERYAWLWFAVLSGSVIPLALLIYVNPTGAIELWARFGYELPATIAADEASLAYIEFISHWASTGTIGFDLFALAVAATAFRQGHRWAWLVFWYWPVLFVTHFFTYQSDFRYLQLVWTAITVGLLMATFDKAWRRHPERAGADPRVRSAAASDASD